MLKSRKDFPELLNNLGLTDVAVEVGVCRGDFARNFLERWKGRIYNMVDPFKHQGAKLDKSDVSQEQHDDNFEAVSRLIRENKNPNKPWVQLFREFSLDAASRPFSTSSLDFVYIDARHDYRSVTEDLNAWYPLVKNGGIIAGHDYKDSFVRRNLVEVKRSVDAFFYLKEPVLTTVDDNLPSWYVVKDDSWADCSKPDLSVYV